MQMNDHLNGFLWGTAITQAPQSPSGSRRAGSSAAPGPARWGTSGADRACRRHVSRPCKQVRDADGTQQISRL